MTKFERVTLPRAIKSVESEIKALDRRRNVIGRQLDDEEEWSGHFCDCNRCPSQDRIGLSLVEVEELDEEYTRLVAELTDKEDELRRLKTYAQYAAKVGLTQVSNDPR